ncbi:MAG: pimeloyl-ACP methyl ester carboxylesterase [Myxococcota bacterium]
MSGSNLTRRLRRPVVSRIAHDACVESEPLALDNHWWRSLDPAFSKLPEGFDLAGLDRLRVGATGVVDRFVRTFAATSLIAFGGPSGYNPVQMRLANKDREFYEPFALRGEAERFFEAPRGLPTVRVRRSRSGGFRPKHGHVESLRFKSTFVPRNPRLRESYAKFRRNSYAHVRYWRHRNGPRPTLIAIHGFGAESYSLNQWFFALPWLYHTLGVDVALFNLPFHGRRQTQFSPFSGHGFFAGGPSRINEGFAQAVHDFRTLLDYLSECRGVNEVGVTGISLGGYTTALLAGVEPRLRFAIPNVPVVSLADLMMEWQPVASVLRAVLKATGLTLPDVRQMLAVSSPLTYAPVIPRERLMVIGGVGDRMAPPKHSRLLWDHWDRCRLHWFPGSHLLHLDRSGYLDEIGRFLRDIDFVR